ncbi:hypothetical protein [Roseisolibacter agri]|uniref:Uncharacterized protein n=1 Tax=Roseisolibacter agri TaxID=2014610 RepID=A0AA37PZH1_9BACT|nr:hypothetical protein [Roseisolibacter agri]GLC23544.1 hypothetical protein rosag_00570 [Roseisolibacter agri]
MSYDLYLVRAPAGADDDFVEAIAMAAAESDGPAGPPDPAVEARKRALADALCAADPTLTASTPDHAAIAGYEGISIEESRRRHRQIEVYGPPDGHGILVTLHDDWVSLEMPHGRGDAGMATLLRYVGLLTRLGGFVAFDPQGPNVVDPSEYGGPRQPTPVGVHAVAPDDKAMRPWWRFW